jgi:small-conductance mechanosensitive channel
MATNTSKPATCILSAEEFISRFPKHILRKSYIKMRNGGFFSPGLRPRLAVLLSLIIFSMMIVACGTSTPEATPTPEATVAPDVTGTVEPAEDGTAPEETAPPAEGESVESVQDVATAVSERTPVPTPTPDRIKSQIDEVTTQTGLAGRTFLGLPIEDWINIGVSGLIILVGYFIFIKLLMRIPRWIAKRHEVELDDEFLILIARYLNWLLLLLLIRFAVLRLDFLSEGMSTSINDLSFILGVGIISIIALDLIQFAFNRYKVSLETDEDQRKLTPVIITIKRLAQTAVLIVAFSIILSYFGINISIILVILVVSGFIISFGAQDILTDILSGYIILIDKPFRVGDTILIKELETRGVVLEIGTRSTQIKTGDNREVIIPNSSIGESQVVNYTYPDSQFRVQTEIGVAYGTDIKEMRKVIEEAVLGVEGVLSDKPVDIFYLKFGDSARLVRVRWWIDTYKDENPMLDKVNSVLELALGEAGIELPNITYDLNVKKDE